MLGLLLYEIYCSKCLLDFDTVEVPVLSPVTDLIYTDSLSQSS